MWPELSCVCANLTLNVRTRNLSNAQTYTEPLNLQPQQNQIPKRKTTWIASFRKNTFDTPGHDNFYISHIGMIASFRLTADSHDSHASQSSHDRRDYITWHASHHTLKDTHINDVTRNAHIPNIMIMTDEDLAWITSLKRFTEFQKNEQIMTNITDYAHASKTALACLTTHTRPTQNNRANRIACNPTHMTCTTNLKHTLYIPNIHEQTKLTYVNDTNAMTNMVHFPEMPWLSWESELWQNWYRSREPMTCMTRIASQIGLTQVLEINHITKTWHHWHDRHDYMARKDLVTRGTHITDTINIIDMLTAPRSLKICTSMTSLTSLTAIPSFTSLTWRRWMTWRTTLAWRTTNKAHHSKPNWDINPVSRLFCVRICSQI